MFSERQIALASRRERLLAQADLQRAQIAAAFRHWERPAAVADRGIAVVRTLKAHPLLLAAVVGVAAVLGRRSVLRLAGRGLIAWQTWQSVAGWMRRLRV